MTGDLLLVTALLTGAAVGGGAFLLALAVRGLPARPARPRRDHAAMWRKLSTRGGAAALAGGLTLVVTRWPVAALGAALLVVGWRGLVGGAAEERLAMQRLEALAAWTESLRDTIAGAVGLEQAIPASVRAASPLIRSHLRILVDRLHTRVPLPEALRRLADDLDDPGADLVVGALILNARLRGPGLRDLLTALAASAREELDVRRRVEASRRATRRSVQIVVGVSVGVMALLVLFNRSYVAEYNSLTGQVVLLVVVGLFAAGFAWLRRLAKFDAPRRFLSGSAPGVPTEVPATVARWAGDDAAPRMTTGGLR